MWIVCYTDNSHAISCLFFSLKSKKKRRYLRECPLTQLHCTLKLMSQFFFSCPRGTVLTEEEKDAIGTAFAAETNRRDEDTQM